ncbi:MAG TPA: DUF5667 domain-containing protein, partial [Candidatus Binatia bacterium]|nr:DUF5667 domain-containing protein [Candidatus Binatia bacterium]
MRFAIGITLVLLLATSVAAHENVDPGVGPSSWFWGLDRALENIKMILTFDRAERIRIGLDIAAERIAEAQAAQDANETEDAADALAAYDVAASRVKAQLEKFDDADTAAVVLADIEDRLDEQAHALAGLQVAEATVAGNTVLADVRASVEARKE